MGLYAVQPDNSFPMQHVSWEHCLLILIHLHRFYGTGFATLRSHSLPLLYWCSSYKLLKDWCSTYMCAQLLCNFRLNSCDRGCCPAKQELASMSFLVALTHMLVQNFMGLKGAKQSSPQQWGSQQRLKQTSQAALWPLILWQVVLSPSDFSRKPGPSDFWLTRQSKGQTPTSSSRCGCYTDWKDQIAICSISRSLNKRSEHECGIFPMSHR